MAASIFDSAIYRELAGDAEVAKLFTDTAEIRAMLLVEGALAKAQGKVGLIPEVSAAAIDRAAREVQIDPSTLAAATGQNGGVVPALIPAFRQEMSAPEHAQFVHWGATTQDIVDTAMMLRLRQVIGIQRARLRALIQALGELAAVHCETPVAGRTFGQIATPTSFGAIAASWGQPLVHHLNRLDDLEPRLLQVSLGGAAGTLSAMGEDGHKVRAELADMLRLGDPARNWHTTRETVAEYSSWQTMLTGTLGKLGEDLILFTQSGIQEVTLQGSGASSTMPQKSNPVLPSLLVALSSTTAGLNQIMQMALVHRQQRDGTAWFSEWMSLPQITIATSRALSAAQQTIDAVRVNQENMLTNLDDGLGLIFAEALSFALARQMPRPDAQREVKSMCQQAIETGTPLPALAIEKWPQKLPDALFSASANLGTAPQEARDFAQTAKSI